MANKEPGYVYIFTNESFREGWVKIGKTQDINKRLNQLDNTSCPMPFDVYATLKTRRYDEAEEFVHDFISHFNSDLRVRPNREYFKVNPEEALDILYKVMKLMDEPEAEIIVNDEKGKQHLVKLEKKNGKGCKSKNVEPKQDQKFIVAPKAETFAKGLTDLTNEKAVIFVVRNKKRSVKAYVKYHPLKNKYILLEGSLISTIETSCAENAKKIRYEIINNPEVCIREGNSIKVIKNVELPIPSGRPSLASDVIVGASTQGTVTLKTMEGKTFAELYPER